MGRKKKKTKVGYKYYFSLLSALGRGAVNEVVAISADDKTVFAGYANELAGNKSIYINKPNLFGGTDVGGEGGIKGVLEIAMGEADQTPSNRVKAFLGGVVPGFRGIVTTYFDGLICAYSTSPKPWKYRVRRTTKGWSNGEIWYPEKCTVILQDTSIQDINLNDEIQSRLSEYPTILKPFRTASMTDVEWKAIWQKYLDQVAEREAIKQKITNELTDNIKTIHAMNPAHILVECATNKEWGRGLDLNEDLDLASFKECADKLYKEKFGLCFRYNRQDGLDTFIQQVLDHIGATQYVDLETGKIKMKLIRDDYKLDDLPLFNYDNGILAIQDDDSSASDNVANYIMVKWHNPVTNTEKTAHAKNIGAIQAVGLISNTIEYKAIPTFELATRVAQRQLESGIAGLKRFTILFDRRGERLTPAACFRISLPDRDVKDMVMRVGSITEREEGIIEVVAIQDVFGLADTVYSSGNQTEINIIQDNRAHPVEHYALFEAPFITISQLSNNKIDDAAGYFMLVSDKPTSMSINYLLNTATNDTDFVSRGSGDWTPSATLVNDIAKTTLTFDVTFNSPLTDVEIGSAAILNDEIVRVDAIDELKGLVTIARGCADTLPQSHAAESILWFYDKLFDSDSIEYIANETIYIQQLTQTNNATLDSHLAPIRTLKFNSRQARPYAPANLLVNNKMTNTIILDDNPVVLSWSHRNKEIQRDNLIAYNEGDVAKPDTVEYHIDYYLNKQIAKTAITEENSYTLEIGETESFDEIRVYAYDVKSELESLQQYVLTITAQNL